MGVKAFVQYDKGHVVKNWHPECLPKYLIGRRDISWIVYHDGGYDAMNSHCDYCRQIISEKAKR
jgi:hypothetical protein